MWLGLPHFSIACIPQCLCTHPINLMCIHLLYYIHGNVCMGTHDVVCNTFVTIAWNIGFHVGQEQLHVFLSIAFNSSCQQVDIMITKNGIRTLINIIIADPTRANLLPWSYAAQRFVVFLCTPKLLDGLNYEFKGEDNKRRRSWGMFLGSQHFGGKGAC